MDSDNRFKGTSEQIADRLRSDIECGTLSPGSFLNQVALAKRFGLSRIPVREALRQLSAEGYVSYRPNKGATVVTQLSTEDLDEIFEIRECLEHRLMKHAVSHFTPKLLKEATEQLASMNRAAASGGEVIGRHQDFHTLLFKAAARPRMTIIVNDWRFHLDERRTRSFILAARPLHRQLLDSCVAKDRMAIRRCITDETALLREMVPA